MTTNKSHWSRLTVDIFNRSLLLDSHPYIITYFSQKPFNINTPLGRGTSIYTNGFSHMTKMAVTPIYDKKNFQNQKADDLGTKFVQTKILG